MDSNSTELRFDKEIYSIECVKETLYRFSDKLSGVIETHEKYVVVQVHFSQDVRDAKACVAEFNKQLLDQSLRERIRDETADIRRLILAHTFSNTKLAKSPD